MSLYSQKMFRCIMIDAEQSIKYYGVNRLKITLQEMELWTLIHGTNKGAPCLAMTTLKQLAMGDGHVMYTEAAKTLQFNTIT